MTQHCNEGSGLVRPRHTLRLTRGMAQMTHGSKIRSAQRVCVRYGLDRPTERKLPEIGCWTYKIIRCCYVGSFRYDVRKSLLQRRFMGVLITILRIYKSKARSGDCLVDLYDVLDVRPRKGSGLISQPPGSAPFTMFNVVLVGSKASL